MEEDWGLTATAPTFSLFRNVTPEDEAKKDSFVDIVVYNRWKKSERRLYQRLKAERIARQIEDERLETMDDLANALQSLNMLKADSSKEDPLCAEIDSLIGKVTKMTLKASTSGPKNTR